MTRKGWKNYPEAESMVELNGQFTGKEKTKLLRVHDGKIGSTACVCWEGGGVP